MIIEKGKYYIQIKNGFVHDAVSYNPNIESYQLYQAETIPADILNGCYKLVNGKLVLDKAKHAEYLAELERQAEEIEMQ